MVVETSQRPFVIRAQNGRGLHWVLTTDSHGIPSEAIDRTYEVPAASSKGEVVTEQKEMRRDLKTENQHRQEALRQYPGAYELASIGNGNLGANLNIVGYTNGNLTHVRGESIYRKKYTCLVSYKKGRVTIEDVFFANEFNQPRIQRKDQSGLRDISSDIDFVTSGQPLVRDGVKVPLDHVADQFYDTRHLVSPIRLTINGTALFYPNSQLQMGLLRTAINGPIRIALLAQIDGETVLPLSVKSWFRFAEADPNALQKTAEYLHTNKVLTASEMLDQPDVLMRVAKQTEALLAKALKASGYKELDSLGTLHEGQYCFINSHLEIFLRRAIYPHNVFVIFQDDSSGAVVWPGKSGREGTTLPDAQEYLTEILGVRDAILLDNGGDVRLSYRGRKLVTSSEKRQQIHSMLMLLAEPDAQIAGAVQLE